MTQFTAFPSARRADFGVPSLQHDDLSDFDLPPGNARRALRLFYGLIGCPDLDDLEEEDPHKKVPAEPPVVQSEE